MRRGIFAAAVVAVLSASLMAQSRDRSGRTGRSDDWCRDGGDSQRYRECEVRESTVPGGNPLDIDPGRNGGVRITGWDRPEVHVRAKISAYAETQAEAKRLASGVRIDATGTSIRAEGPATDSDQHWNVSFEVQVPRNAMLNLHTINGGISIEDFRGTAKFSARNGGVSLSNVGGDIRGETTNGGITVDLSGDRWDGEGLDVETHNGGVKLTVPDNYSAALETGTVNGRINVDFPMTVQGRLSRQLTTTLGSGGAKLRVMTTNGGVSIRRK
jgi:DUF4097 and DUF4098 domain-containing protein YvlB